MSSNDEGNKWFLWRLLVSAKSASTSFALTARYFEIHQHNSHFTLLTTRLWTYSLFDWLIYNVANDDSFAR